ncbi:MAG TPA: GAF domain-containing protein [Gemmatimonadaceae bacterium]|nr:GAF domain-containing protein [Gemmatimonadaceae bacterium]
MPPRTLASLAHALGAASDLDAALVSLGEALAELDRSARLALVPYDGRRQMLRERLTPAEGMIAHYRVETTFDHFPTRVREQVAAGGQFVDLGDESDVFARLLGMTSGGDDALLALRGIRVDGALSALLVLYESKRFFGTRVAERFGPHAALFDLAFTRFAERDARDEAVRTLEDVTQRVHGEYVRKLAEMEEQLAHARGTPSSGVEPVDAAQLLALEQEAAHAREESRRARHRADAIEQQLSSAIGQLEYAHVELHRRSEALRQRTRTLYLLDRLLSLQATTPDPRQLVDGLLALVGDDMQAQRCSLMLRVPGTDELYIAAARGLAPEIADGTRIQIGRGVAGKVAASREPLLVTDVADASSHPLLRDEYFTTGSFISFPLVAANELIGVVNLTNRAQRGVFVEEDIDRVRLLALVISLAAAHAMLPERLLDAIGAR